MDRLTDDYRATLVRLSVSALLLTDRSAVVHDANPAAEALLVETAMMSVKGGVLSARRKSEDKDLRAALATMSAEHPASTVCFRNREGVPMVVIDLLLLAGGLVACRISDLESRPSPTTARLRAIFGLSPAEARVAAAMLSGLGIQGVAHKHAVEAETVRTQLKRIRGKTGARSLNELLGVLTAAGSDFGPKFQPSAPRPSPAPAEDGKGRR